MVHNLIASWFVFQFIDNRAVTYIVLMKINELAA